MGGLCLGVSLTTNHHHACINPYKTHISKSFTTDTSTSIDTSGYISAGYGTAGININLPSNLEARYELVARSGIMDFIMPKINSNQYNDIVVAVRDRIDYACDSNTVEFRRSVDKMTEFMSGVQEKITEMFGDISAEDVKKVFGEVGDTRSVEARVVDEYIKQKNEGLKIVRTE